ncbi:hypothetical protein BYT27DRAFT_7197408, partial [Phlegmacium glaucopus]
TTTREHGNPNNDAYDQCLCETMVLTWQRRSVFKSWISLSLHKEAQRHPDS